MIITKLTAFLLTILFLNLHVTGQSQTVTLSGKNASLKQAFAAIKKQTGYFVFFKQGLLNDTRPVTYSVSNMAIADFLDLLLKDQPIRYAITGKNIFLTKKNEAPEPANQPVNATLPSVSLSGRVLDENSVPVHGATVAVLGTAKATSTSADGRFMLVNVPDNVTIQVSSVNFTHLLLHLSNGILSAADNGFKGQLVNSSLTGISIRLKPSESKLDEVRVIAYGSDTKRFSVGSVSTVNASDIEKQPVGNVLLALQGQVPGLVVTPTSGAPGSAVKIQVRGQNTLYAGNNGIKPYDQPLFIVDGVPMATQNNNINQLSSLGASSTADNFGYFGGQSPFGTINPLDIESISILKDADATSIYGSQGSNGVILITTKKGKAGKPTLDLSVNSGVNIATRMVPMLNTKQYLQMRREAFANDGITTVQGTNLNAANFAPDLTIFDQNKNTDWFNYLMGSTSPNTDAHASFSGGTATTNFILAGGTTHQGYNFPGHFADDRYTFHSGFQYNSADKRLNVGLTADFGYENNNSSSVATLTRNILTPPNYPDLIDPGGKLIWNYQGYDLSSYQTYGALKRPGKMQAYNMNDALLVSYQIVPGLKFTANLGYSRFTNSENQQTPLASIAPGSSSSSATFASSAFQTLNLEPQLNFSHTWGKGVLTVLAGGNYKKTLNNSTQLKGTNYTNDALLGSITGATTVTTSDAGNMYKYAGAFGRIGYIFDRKYIVSLTGRRDGSSNFGPGNQFGNFGSAGLGWIFSEEQGFKLLLPFISYGKLSGSYGTSGSDAIAPYRYQTFWQAVSLAQPFQGFKPFAPSNLYNPDYGWDVKKTLNTSIDLGFWEDRLLVNASWYRSRSGNQLINAKLPIQSGATQVLENSPATVQNSGWEFTLTSTNIRTKDFRWSSNFNISGYRNKLLKFPGLATSAYAGAYVIGKPITNILVYKYKGVDPQTGVFQFYDQKGKTTFSPANADRALLEDFTPDFFGGLGNTLTYKSWSLFFMFQFSKEKAVNWLGSLYGQSNIPGQLINLPVAALGRWQKPGDVSDIQKLTANNQAAYNLSSVYFTGSTGAYSDGSYVRLKTISISYSLPTAYLKKIALKSCKLYINAQNLFLISGYKVGDPESGGALYSFPLQRTIVGGLSINF